MARAPIGEGHLKYIVWYPLALLLAVLALLIWFKGSPQLGQSASDSVTVLSESATGQWLKLPATGVEGRLSSRYVTASEERRARVLQNLSEFRAAYKQLAPFIEIRAAAGLESRQRLAQRLGSELSHYGLGRALTGESRAPQDGERAALILYGSRGNAEMIRGLLAALSPYLAGEVLVQFDEAMRSDRLELYLLGEPGFTGDGVAVFSNK